MFEPLITMKMPSNKLVEEVLKGSIDMHVHATRGNIERRVSFLEAAIDARNRGMRALAFKFLYFPVNQEISEAKKIVPEVELIGGFCLDECGLNAERTETVAGEGCRILWFPANTAVNNRICQGLAGGLYILNEEGNLKREVYPILEIVKQYNMVLASGHMSFAEVEALFAAANNMGIKRLFATHPLAEFLYEPFTASQIERLADMGAYIEHCFCHGTPRIGSMDPMKWYRCINTIGADRTILCTDMAQVTDPPPAEGMRMFIALLLALGISKGDVEKMVKMNPARLLGLE